MALQDNDLFVVGRGAESYKLQKDQLEAALTSDDMTIQDTDLFLVARDEYCYNLKFADLKTELNVSTEPPVEPIPPVLTDVALTQNSITAERFTGKSFTTNVTSFGGEVEAVEMTASVTGVLGFKAGSNPIVTSTYTGTADTDVVVDLRTLPTWV